MFNIFYDFMIAIHSKLVIREETDFHLQFGLPQLFIKNFYNL